MRTAEASVLLVIVNSDIAIAQVTEGVLSEAHAALVDACVQDGHVIVLPLTAKLEFDRHHGVIRDGRIQKLEGAYTQLAGYSVGFDRQEPEDLIPTVDLVQLYEDRRAAVEVDEPTLEDFEDAHQRACMHESPQNPNTKSDEMRDLIIWVQSLRRARGAGGALLLSADEVHVHPRGDEEAAAASLHRYSTMEDALSHLMVATPAAGTVMALLAPLWPLLRDAGLPLDEAPTPVRVTDAVFVNGDDGLNSASATLTISTNTGVTIEANAGFSVGASAVDLALTSINVDGVGISAIEVSGPRSRDLPHVSSYSERIDSLRRSGIAL